MSPIEYIKEGIIKCNWKTVCEGYKRLTGESLLLSEDHLDEVQQIRKILSQIIDIASLPLDNPTKKIIDPTTKLNKSKQGRSKKQKKKITNKSTKVTEDGEDASLQLDEKDKTYTKKEIGKIHLITNEPDPKEVERNEIKAMKSNRNKLQLNRTRTNNYEVKCNECLQIFISTRQSGEMGQKCKRCLNSWKGRFV